MLKNEIDDAQRLVKTDAYQLSIGEIINMYKNEELVINPDFQRLFRWEIGQKSKLIELLLLGIPLPSIFVFEKEDSTWELIDGLQRISTLLEFMGELKDVTTGQLRPPTALVATKYLPSLDKAVWEKSELVADIPFADQNPLIGPQQLAIKRSRLSVEILKPYTEQDLSNIFDVDLIWRRKELSDLKAAIKIADPPSKPALLRAIIAMSYAHWEGYIRTCANRYFEYLTLRKMQFAKFERQIYVNSFLVRLDALRQGRVSLEARCKLINDILDGIGGRFSYLNPELVDTRSNLNTDVIKDICIICGIDLNHFEQNRTFLDVQMLRRRNAIAHGQQEFIQMDEIDGLVANVLALMGFFRTLLENKVYTNAYTA